ncbi:SLC13 family permease [Flavihumibacter solisilvae]|uniref:GntT/GntP/DsdX family permease n=1 Tax=Flavihumibacter solisilvae TaxID=1349421 RepID=UPI000689B11B|nr:SLC13 family permease [Flavihumibacter solisilvae]
MKQAFSLHPFLVFLLVAIAIGLCSGSAPAQLAISLEKGIGDVLSSLLMLIVLGAMFGKLVAESGAAQRVSRALVNLFGTRYIHWAMMLIGFIAGVPLFYGVGFVLLVPLVFSVSQAYRLPPVFTGIPLLAALSVTHGFLPPHPSPSALVVQFGADLRLTLIYGLIVCIPAIIIAGPLFARTLKRIHSEPLAAFVVKERPDAELPSLLNSIITILLPILLLVFTELPPSLVLLAAVIYATVSLGLMQGMNMSVITQHCGSAVKDIAPVLLIIAGAGALKEVLTASGAGGQIAASLQHLAIHPLVLGWLMAAIIRICIGSATVAGLTTAGIIQPFMVASHTDPNMMVLAVGAGSLACSHVNDAGFWMFKEYFNVSIRDTLRSWTIMESIVAVTGLLGVLLLNSFIAN